MCNIRLANDTVTDNCTKNNIHNEINALSKVLEHVFVMKFQSICVRI